MTYSVSQNQKTQFKTERFKDEKKHSNKTKGYFSKDVYKKPEYIPFKKSSDFVSPLKSHSGFYVKKSNEQVCQISTNIGTKNKRFVDENGIKQDLKTYVITCYENNIQVDYIKCNTIEEANLKTKSFLKNYAILLPKTTEEETEKGVLSSLTSYVFKGKKQQFKNNLSYEQHLEEWKKTSDNTNVISKD